MASTRISAPMRGVALQWGRLPLRPYGLSARRAVCCGASARPMASTPARKSSCAPSARAISTSTSPKAALSPVTTSADGYVPIRPFEEQTVLATIHRFPSLEPLRFEQYPANHLYLPTRKDILHRAVVFEGDGTRLGTASTKTRYEVHGSRRKIRPQKGSGRARLGDKRSPMLRGGGVAFGPKPRDFSSDLPKKVYDLAWRTALSYRFRKGELIIVDNAMEIESPSQRLLNDIFMHHERLRGRGRSLLVTLEVRPMLEQALAEMDRGEQTLTWEEVDVKNLLELSRVIIERKALHNILFTHEEDLTHRTVQPWHKSLVRSSAPDHLESTIGWPEFRALALADPKDKDSARVDAYESVASTRYTYAESLPHGPERTEHTLSAYKLLAEAKELQFLQKTGLGFHEYARLTAIDHASEVAPLFPRIQALDYQISVKNDLVAASAETSRVKSEEVGVEVRQLEVQKLEVQYEAALLAAQVHEHAAETERLAGDEEAAEDTLELASAERTNVDLVEMQMLEAKLELAKQVKLVAGYKANYIDQQKAQEDIRQCTEAIEAKRTEAAVWDAQMAELEEAELDDPAEMEIAEAETRAELEAPRVETVVDVKGEPVVDVKGEPVVDVKGEPVVDVKGEPVVGVKEEPVVGVKEEPVVGVKEEPVADGKEVVKQEKR